MGKEYLAKVFKSGNSVALRLPKELGFTEGSTMVLREEQSGYHFGPAEVTPKKIDLTGIWGSIPDLKPLAADERLMEPRELDWDGAKVVRD